METKINEKHFSGASDLDAAAKAEKVKMRAKKLRAKTGADEVTPEEIVTTAPIAAVKMQAPVKLSKLEATKAAVGKKGAVKGKKVSQIFTPSSFYQIIL